MARVEYDRVTKRFGNVTALDELTLPIEDGEFIVLVGPSGSGKTTALRLLAGLEAITSGTVRIGERVVNTLAPRDRDIAMVFQDYALYPQMTVSQNLAFGLRMRKTPRDEIDRRVRFAAEVLGMSELLHRRPGALSGGQRQRVALGRAIVREPQVFLMDEPLSNLDAKLRVQTRSEIKRIQDQIGTTTVYVTHDQVEAMTMGDRIAVMSEGVLAQVGSPTDLYEHPRNVFVAGFIGSPSMSFAKVRAERDDDGLRLSNGTFCLAVPGVGAARARPADVILGVRPEHGHIWRTEAGLVGPVEGEVEFVELLGRESFVGLRAAPDVRFTFFAPPDVRLRPGDRSACGFERGSLYLFDASDEIALERV
jgi:multiple sugar transport system ATP-binding protein